MKKGHILVVDDNDDYKDLVVSAFKSVGFKIDGVSDSIEAIKYIDKNNYDLVISDFYMPRGDGLDLLKEIKKTKPLLPLILITAYSDKDLLSRALKSGALNFFDKSIPLTDLITYSESVLNFISSLHRTIPDSTQNITDLSASFDKRLVMYSDEQILINIPPLILNDLQASGYIEEEDSMKLSVVLVEILSNALYHGNFGIASDIRDYSIEGQAVFKKMVNRKVNDKNFRSKKIILECYADKEILRFSVEDEGEGFDWKKKWSSKSSSGRGFLLIDSFVDKIDFNEKGNRITVTKYTSKG